MGIIMGRAVQRLSGAQVQNGGRLKGLVFFWIACIKEQFYYKRVLFKVILRSFGGLEVMSKKKTFKTCFCINGLFVGGLEGFGKEDSK